MKTQSIFLGGLTLLSPFALAEPEKVTDLRIPADVSPGYITYYDYGFGPVQTRMASEAPVLLPAEFSVTSSVASMASGDRATDPRLTSFTGPTRVTQLNRFATAANPDPGAA